MKTATLRKILRARLLEVPDLPLIRHEGVTYERGTGTYLEEEFGGGAETNLANGYGTTRALYFLTLRTPPGNLFADMDSVTDALLAAFQAGTTLTDSAQSHTVEISSFDCGRMRRLEDGSGYRRFTIGATAWALRPTFVPT